MNDIPSVMEAAKQLIDEVLPTILAINAVLWGLWLGARLMIALWESYSPDKYVIGAWDLTSSDEKPKRKNDDVDPFEETTAPYMTIGDDGELVEVERE